MWFVVKWFKQRITKINLSVYSKRFYIILIVNNNHEMPYFTQIDKICISKKLIVNYWSDFHLDVQIYIKIKIRCFSLGRYNLTEKSNSIWIYFEFFFWYGRMKNGN